MPLASFFCMLVLTGYVSGGVTVLLSFMWFHSVSFRWCGFSSLLSSIEPRSKLDYFECIFYLSAIASFCFYNCSFLRRNSSYYYYNLSLFSFSLFIRSAEAVLAADIYYSTYSFLFLFMSSGGGNLASSSTVSLSLPMSLSIVEVSFSFPLESVSI